MVHALKDWSWCDEINDRYFPCQFVSLRDSPQKIITPNSHVIKRDSPQRLRA